MPKLMVDPPAGWKYGFPKVLPPEHRHRALDWVIEQGYPPKEVEACGKHFYMRYWEIPD